MSKDRINELADDLLRAKYTYYNIDMPDGMQPLVLTDKVYDAKENEMRSLDPDHWILKIVGAPVIQSEWKKAKHQIPMGSLNKVNAPSELTDWAKDKDCKSWFTTEKLDGLSIELIYEHGKLVQSITRGSGVEGEDISCNVIRMAGVNSDLKEDFNGSLRGEIIMLKSIHEKHFTDKANPRNAASGISKRLDGVGSDKLNILFYQVLGDVDFKTEVEQFKWLRSHKIGTPNYWTFKTADEVNKHWRDYQDDDRKKLDYDIDGLVVRINDMAKQEAWGDKDLRPLGAIAFKFDNESASSIIRALEYQCGHSGRLTPVATFDPVQLVGATITRASLYNMAYIEDLGLDIGAEVMVVRCNDVIPSVKEVIKSTGSIAKPPTHCPECDGEVEVQGEYLVCNNLSCPARLRGRIHNWINEINILEWGDTLISKIVETGLVKTVADLYTLTVDDLASVDRMGEKSAQKCYDNLWAAKEMSLEIFLGGLSIPLIGQSTIKAIMNAGCDTLEKFGKLDAAAFEKVPGVGPTKAKSLADGLKNNQQLILDIIKNGVKIKDKVAGSLTGKSVCFTGKSINKRAVLEKMAADAGGDVKSSVGRGLSYLVIADPNSTSGKAQSARKLGTTLISEDEFLEMVK